MVDLVEGFREVEKDSVYLARLIEAVGEVAESGYELSFTTSTVAKAGQGVACCLAYGVAAMGRQWG